MKYSNNRSAREIRCDGSRVCLVGLTPASTFDPRHELVRSMHSKQMASILSNQGGINDIAK